MTNKTLSMPEDASREMKQFSEVRWSEVARKAMIEILETLKLAEKLASKSALSMKDVEEFSSKIKSAGTRWFLA